MFTRTTLRTFRTSRSHVTRAFSVRQKIGQDRIGLDRPKNNNNNQYLHRQKSAALRVPPSYLNSFFSLTLLLCVCFL